jgi:hypothetical protein
MSFRSRYRALHPNPQPKQHVDYSSPTPIRYTCTRCGAERTAMVTLREIIHQSDVGPKICPLCAARAS